MNVDSLDSPHHEEQFTAPASLLPELSPIPPDEGDLGPEQGNPPFTPTPQLSPESRSRSGSDELRLFLHQVMKNEQSAEAAAPPNEAQSTLKRPLVGGDKSAPPIKKIFVHY